MVVLGYVFSVTAMRTGEIGFVAPFRYASLIAALILGYVVFGDWPRNITLLGAFIVVATGMFTLYREQVASATPAKVCHNLPGLIAKRSLKHAILRSVNGAKGMCRFWLARESLKPLCDSIHIGQSAKLTTGMN